MRFHIFQRFILGFYIVAVFFGIVLTSSESFSASAVAVSKDNTKFEVCFGEASVKDAEACVLKKCGEGCNILKSCEKTGHGYVAQNFLNDPSKKLIPITSTACGTEVHGDARGQAIAVCQHFSRIKNHSLNTCHEKTSWYDVPKDNEKEAVTWCEFATKISGIKSLEECLKSSRYPVPEKDCPHHVKQWCRKF